MTEEMTGSQKPEVEERQWEELRLLYSSVLEDIRFHKDRQIKYVYYTFLLYSIIIYFHVIAFKDNESTAIGIILTVFGLAFMFIGITFTCISQADIRKARKRRNDVIEEFTQKFKDILNNAAESELTEILSSVILGIFILLQFGGGVFIAIYILCGLC